jgi:hypothetical protein
MATFTAKNAGVREIPSHLVTARPRPRFGRVRATVVGVFMIGLCLLLSGGTSSPIPSSPAFLIAGMSAIPSPPEGSSWAPKPVQANGLEMVASTDGQQFRLHTAGGDRTFLPGVDLGGTTPGHGPGDLSISAAQYRAWLAAMSRLGIRVVRIYTIHPPAFYQQLAAYNEANPARPLYLVQGVPLPGAYLRKRNLFDPAVTAAFQRELKDASSAVAGRLSRRASAGVVSGVWNADVTRWLLGWIIGTEIDPYAAEASDKRNADASGHQGRYFRSTDDAGPTERWLAARMDELAGYQARLGLSQPIAFVNGPATDPLRHPEEPLARDDLLQLDANHVRPTADWPAGTFAAYHPYPFYPDFLRHEPALRNYGYAGRSDPYAGYVAALGRHHPDMPTVIAEFGVPSSIGSARNGPLGRDQGDHSEQEAMRIDADLLRLIHDQNLAGGFLFEWTDEWFKSTWNTSRHQDAGRRPLWHDPMTGDQHFGLLAMDAGGRPGGSPQRLLDTQGGWPARRVTATVDESYVNLRITLGGSPPDSLALGFDVLPGLTGAPFAGSGDHKPDAVLALNLGARTGQAYLRDELDPMPLDYAVPDSRRGPAPPGWKPFNLLVNRPRTVPGSRQRLPLELQDAGILRYGSWGTPDPRADSRSVWHVEGDDLVVRVPWALLGFADPSSHEVAVPKSSGAGQATLSTQVSPGITMSITAAGSVQQLTQLTWVNWARPGYAERLKEGADRWRDAAFDLAP